MATKENIRWVRFIKYGEVSIFVQFGVKPFGIYTESYLLQFLYIWEALFVLTHPPSETVDFLTSAQVA